MQRAHTGTPDDKKARQLNLKIMLGCMNESTIGTAAMVHLSPWLTTSMQMVRYC